MSDAIVLRTVAGRQTFISGPCSVQQVQHQAALAFAFVPASVRLVRQGKLLQPHDAVSCGEELVVVGRRCRKTSEAQKTPPPRETSISPNKVLCSPIVGEALPRLHCPDGLVEVVGLANDLGPLAIAVLRHHPTVQWMTNFVSGDPARLELVMRQCQRECPLFVQWVQHNAQLFLQLLNGGLAASPAFPIHANSCDDLIIVRGPDGGVLEWGESEYGELELHLEVVEDGGLAEGPEGIDEDDEDDDEVCELQSLERQLHELMLNTSQPVERMLAMARLAAAYRNRFERLGDCEESATRYTRDAMSLAVDSFAGFATVGDEIVRVFSAADKWFAERHPFSAFVARTGHQLVEELCSASVVTALDCFVEARRLCDYSKATDTTFIALYPSYHDQGTEVFVITRGDVMVRSLSAGMERLEAGAAFLSELTADSHRQGIALTLWNERLAGLHGQFIEPILDLLPSNPHAESFLDAGAPVLCMLTPKLSRPVPFAAFLDKQEVPLLAKFALFQAFSVDPLINQKQRSSRPVSVFHFDEQQPWMSRALLRTLGATCRRSTDALTVVHGPVLTQQQADLVLVENYCDHIQWSQFRSAALVRVLACNSPLPYEFLRVFYTYVSEGCALSRAVRQASLATAAVFPAEPWLWAAMCLIQSGAPLRALLLVNSPPLPMPKAQRPLTMTNEAKYCVEKAIPDIYDAMVNSLIADKPKDEVSVLETLIECLCSREQDLTAPNPLPRDNGAAAHGTFRAAA